MEQNEMPSSKTVAEFIKESCGQKNYVDIDMVELKGVYVIAWETDTRISDNQGVYQVAATTYTCGNFSDIIYTDFCRYYEKDGKRQITSSPFGTILSKQETPTMIEKTADGHKEPEAYINLVCNGKAFSQRRIFIKGRQRGE